MFVRPLFGWVLRCAVRRRAETSRSPCAHVTKLPPPVEHVEADTAKLLTPSSPRAKYIEEPLRLCYENHPR